MHQTEVKRYIYNDNVLCRDSAFHAGHQSRRLATVCGIRLQSLMCKTERKMYFFHCTKYFVDDQVI